MVSINNLINSLSETALSRIGIPHDEARISYHLNKNTVDSFDEFTEIIGDYCNHHYKACISNGGLSPHDAMSKAKDLLDQHYRQQNGDIVGGFNDCRDNTNSGLRGVLDIIADQLKMESINRYVRHVFDKMVAPNAWEDKVELIRQFVNHYGFQFSNALDPNQIERYAANYKELIQSFSQSLKQTSSIFRRL